MNVSLAVAPTAAAPVMSFTQAIADDLKLLARFADREADPQFLATLQSTPVAQWFSLSLSGKDCDEAMSLLSDYFANLTTPVAENEIDALAAEYAAIFLTHSYRAAPTESVWRDEEGLERQKSMFDVRSWYERYHVSVPDWRKRSDDHLVHELEFLAFLLKGAETEADFHEAARFMRQHILTWVKPFAAAVFNRCQLPFYAGTTLLTALYLDHLAALIGNMLGQDMTPDPLNPFTKKGETGRSCADPPQQAFVPGLTPSW